MGSICWKAKCIRQFKTKYCQFSKFRLIHSKESRDTFQEWTAHDEKIADVWNIMYSWVWALKLCHALASLLSPKSRLAQTWGGIFICIQNTYMYSIHIFHRMNFQLSFAKKTLFLQYLHIIFHFWAIRAFWPPFSILSYSRWWRL